MVEVADARTTVHQPARMEAPRTLMETGRHHHVPMAQGIWFVLMEPAQAGEAGEDVEEDEGEVGGDEGNNYMTVEIPT